MHLPLPTTLDPSAVPPAKPPLAFRRVLGLYRAMHASGFLSVWRLLLSTLDGAPPLNHVATLTITRGLRGIAQGSGLEPIHAAGPHAMPTTLGGPYWSYADIRNVVRRILSNPDHAEHWRDILAVFLYADAFDRDEESYALIKRTPEEVWRALRRYLTDDLRRPRFD